MYKDADPQTVAVAEKIAAALSNDERFSVEIRSSVVHTRVYVGASKESTDEYYVIQIDKG